jgi:hypothetical protein
MEEQINKEYKFIANLYKDFNDNKIKKIYGDNYSDEKMKEMNSKIINISTQIINSMPQELINTFKKYNTEGLRINNGPMLQLQVIIKKLLRFSCYQNKDLQEIARNIAEYGAGDISTVTDKDEDITEEPKNIIQYSTFEVNAQDHFINFSKKRGSFDNEKSGNLINIDIDDDDQQLKIKSIIDDDDYRFDSKESKSKFEIDSIAEKLSKHPNPDILGSIDSVGSIRNIKSNQSGRSIENIESMHRISTPRLLTHERYEETPYSNILDDEQHSLVHPSLTRRAKLYSNVFKKYLQNCNNNVTQSCAQSQISIIKILYDDGEKWLEPYLKNMKNYIKQSEYQKVGEIYKKIMNRSMN